MSVVAGKMQLQTTFMFAHHTLGQICALNLSDLCTPQAGKGETQRTETFAE